MISTPGQELWIIAFLRHPEKVVFNGKLFFEDADFLGIRNKEREESIFIPKRNISNIISYDNEYGFDEHQERVKRKMREKYG